MPKDSGDHARTTKSVQSRCIRTVATTQGQQRVSKAYKDDDHVPPADSERQPYAATGDLSGGDLYLPQLKAATADRAHPVNCRASSGSLNRITTLAISPCSVLGLLAAVPRGAEHRRLHTPSVTIRNVSHPVGQTTECFTPRQQRHNVSHPVSNN